MTFEGSSLVVYGLAPFRVAFDYAEDPDSRLVFPRFSTPQSISHGYREDTKGCNYRSIAYGYSLNHPEISFMDGSRPSGLIVTDATLCSRKPHDDNNLPFSQLLLSFTAKKEDGQMAIHFIVAVS